MSAETLLEYHSLRAQRELDLGLTANGSAASRSHLRLAALHFEKARGLAAIRGTVMRAPLSM